MAILRKMLMIQREDEKMSGNVRVMVNGQQTVDTMLAVQEEILDFVNDEPSKLNIVSKVIPTTVVSRYPELRGRVSPRIVELAVEALVFDRKLDDALYTGLGMVGLSQKRDEVPEYKGPMVALDEGYSVPDLPSFDSKKEYS